MVRGDYERVYETKNNGRLTKYTFYALRRLICYKSYVKNEIRVEDVA